MKKLTPLQIEKLKLKLKTIMFFTLVWTTAGILFLAGELFSRKDSPFTLLPDNGSRVEVSIAVIIIALLVGIITGIYQTIIAKKRYSKQSIGKMIVINAGFYMVIYFSLFFVGIYLFHKYKGEGENFGMYINVIWNYMMSGQAVFGLLVFGVFVILSLFLMFVREKFGYNVFNHFLSGKYFYPREEDRIFMFLDIKSATTIAERLGPLKYHEFLRDFYAEITYPILYKKGEIYQYVGDEIIVSWSIANGVKNNNCIECFFEIEKAISEKKVIFLKKYGVCPEFKAGFHCGATVTGEIGIIKREIVYSGDTLNSTARIQELCNRFGVKVLMSEDLLNKFKDTKRLRLVDIGNQSIRGRENQLVLYGIEKV